MVSFSLSTSSEVILDEKGSIGGSITTLRVVISSENHCRPERVANANQSLTAKGDRILAFTFRTTVCSKGLSTHSGTITNSNLSWSIHSLWYTKCYWLTGHHFVLTWYASVLVLQPIANTTHTRCLEHILITSNRTRQAKLTTVAIINPTGMRHCGGQNIWVFTRGKKKEIKDRDKEKEREE